MVRRFLRGLWGFAGLVWPFVVEGGVWFAGAGTLWTFLVLLFSIGFALAWLFGFSPSDVTAWLDDHAGLFRWIGNWLWRAFMGVVLLLCALGLYGVWETWFGPKDDPAVPRHVRGGCCGLIAIVIVGYVAWVGMTMPFD